MGTEYFTSALPVSLTSGRNSGSERGSMYRKLARVVLPLVVLAVIAAFTIGLNGNCSGLGEWSIPAA